MSNEKEISISMTSYNWNRLLRDLEDHMRICNRDQTDTILFYEKIATELNDGRPVRVIHEQNPDLAYRPKVVGTGLNSTQGGAGKPGPAPKKSIWTRISELWPK